MNIVIKNNQRYIQYKDRIRRLCDLKECNYPSRSDGVCKKHHTNINEKICKIIFIC
jgi:hypothetical protein